MALEDMMPRVVFPFEMKVPDDVAVGKLGIRADDEEGVAAVFFRGLVGRRRVGTRDDHGKN